MSEDDRERTSFKMYRSVRERNIRIVSYRIVLKIRQGRAREYISRGAFRMGRVGRALETRERASPFLVTPGEEWDITSCRCDRARDVEGM